MIRMNGGKQYYSTNGIKCIDILFQKRYNLYIEVIIMQIREASEKWNISERRIRQLLQDGRIEGAKKIGTTIFFNLLFILSPKIVYTYYYNFFVELSQDKL